MKFTFLPRLAGRYKSKMRSLNATFSLFTIMLKSTLACIYTCKLKNFDDKLISILSKHTKTRKMNNIYELNVKTLNYKYLLYKMKRQNIFKHSTFPPAYDFELLSSESFLTLERSL
jgi:hypothetical protein